MNLKNLKHYEEFYICAYCAYCVNYKSYSACPTFFTSHHEISTGRGKMITARNIAQGVLNKKEGLEALSEGLFSCTFCGACEKVCIVDIPLTEVYTELKTLVQDYLPKGTKKVLRYLDESKNIYGMDQEDRNLWNLDVEEIYEEWEKSSSDIGYFIGCVSSYFTVPGRTPAAILELTKRADAKISIFSPDEYCCGNPYLLGGQIEKAKEFAVHNIQVIEKLGIKTLITSCAGCYRVISQEYPKLLGKKLPFKVITHMEFIYRLIKEGSLKFQSKSALKVSFKDPCELGRHCGVYDIARDLINSIPGIENQELVNNRENALCCGAGGLLKVNHPEMAENIANILIKQMEEKNTEICLNACPSCLFNIDQQLKNQNSKIRAIDISELVLERTS
ncbi:MAG: (Fe-S)-binding protein [Candidatus Hodarchaeota archaeon]